MSGISGPELRIDLLGGFRVAAGEIAVGEAAWRLRAARGLVKLLALSPEHRVHRERLIEALWPDRDPAAASNNLRQAVFAARRALDSCGEDGAARIVVSQDVLILDRERLVVDVELFEAAAAQAELAPSVESQQAAVALYRGELLPEDRFEPWAAARREALRERHLGLLLELARLREQAGDRGAAIGALHQVVSHEPLNERAHRELMRLYTLAGRRQRALAQFHRLRESLRHEVEDDPDEETRRLYQDILTRRLGAEEPAPTPPVPGHGDASPRWTGNLPLQLTSFVGRERPLEETLGLLRRHRLVTLTGPGGCGKTRLALEAGLVLARAGDGVWLVELAGLSDGALVPSAVGEALGVESRSTRPSEEALIAHIGARQLLLVLDNCEHLIGSCSGLVERLLMSCPELRVLATSREPLHSSGEVNWRVPSLSATEGQRLFVERATAASSDFSPSSEQALAIAEICRRVDGIPLAIELAAARVGVLAPLQIARRLRESLSVLGGGQRTALTRQQTLGATLDWSHQLLDADERVLFRRMGTFAGTASLDAVEGVCDGELDVLSRLVDKSLVVVEAQQEVARYRLLDTVRHYARERLAEAGEWPRQELRHRTYFLELAEGLGSVSDDLQARRELAREADEFRWALRNALRSQPDVALRLAAALWRFWHDRGDRNEGARWLEDALRAAPDSSPAGVRVQALHGLSVLALRTSDQPRALATGREAVARCRQSGDPRALSEELHHLGTMMWVFSDYDGADRWCGESRQLAEAAEQSALVASVVHTLGVIAASRNDTTVGRELIARSIELLRCLPEDAEPLLLPVALGYGRIPRDYGLPPRLFLEQTFVTAGRVRAPAAVAYALSDLGAAARNAGDVGESRSLLEQSLTTFREVGDELGAAQAVAQLGNLLCASGEHGLARELLEESLTIRESANDVRGIGLSLLALVVAAGCEGEHERAWSTAQRALDLFERTDDGPGRASALTLLGYVAADRGQLPAAIELQQRALVLWKGFIPHTLWCVPILIELAGLDRARGASEHALDRLREAREICDQNGETELRTYCEQALRQPVNGVLTPP